MLVRRMLLKWVTAGITTLDHSSSVLSSDGTTICDYLYAIDSSNGTIKWSHSTPGGTDSSPAVGLDRTVYYGEITSGNVTALNGTTGAVLWTFHTDSYVESSPAIGPDGTVYV